MNMQFDILCTPAAGNHVRVKAVGQVEDALPVLDDCGLGRLDVEQIDDLDLPRSKSVSVDSATKPPCSPISFDAELSAAITDGSSTAMGTAYPCPLTNRFNPSPSGRPMTPTTFSTILSAEARSRVCRPLASARKSRPVTIPSS